MDPAQRDLVDGIQGILDGAQKVVDDFVATAEEAGDLADEAVKDFERRANKAVEDFSSGIQRMFFFSVGRKKRVGTQLVMGKRFITANDKIRMSGAKKNSKQCFNTLCHTKQLKVNLKPITTT